MELKSRHIGLWNYARSFFLAANKLRGTEEMLSDVPIYYLYGHAIELALKSFLLYQGYDEKDIRKIGHDLKDAWTKATDKSLDKPLANTTEISQVIELINPYYRHKELEYIVTGGKRYPYISEMHNVAEKIICAVGKSIDIPKSQLNKYF